MADTAAHLVDHVVPHVPVRQWVFTVPFPLRFRMAFDRKATSTVRRILLRRILAFYRRRTRPSVLMIGESTRKPASGAICFLQRFGSALNLNPHFHVLVLDGAFEPPADITARPLFTRQPSPTDAEIEDLLDEITPRIEAAFPEIFSTDDGACATTDLPFDSPTLGACYAASVEGRIGLGPAAGRYVPKLGRDPLAPPFIPAGARLAAERGFTLHASPPVAANDRERLERLCRYTARPPIATERLELAADGLVIYRLRRPFRDGTTAVRFAAYEFIEKLAALVPPPRANLVTYHGALAPNHPWRSRVVPSETLDCAASMSASVARRRNTPAPTTTAERHRRATWAELMKRVFGLDVLECPQCHGRRRVIALINDPPVIRRILRCLGHKPDPPQRAPPPSGFVFC